MSSDPRPDQTTETLNETPPTPQGELALQTMAMPKDANASGDIFGGWLVSQMDLAGAVTAQYLARGRVATVAIDHLVFIAPVHIGATVSCYAELLHIGRSSMRLKIEVWTCEPIHKTRNKASEGIFTFVAIDENHRTRTVPRE